MVISPDMFGTGEMTFSPTERLGNNASRMSQIQDGKWKVVADCMSTK
jgi:branched-chain amino acid transport system substrate-binding protein